MNNTIKQQIEKISKVMQGFGYKVTENGPDEYSAFVDISTGVSIYLTQASPDAPIVYGIGYWSDTESEPDGWVPEFQDTTDFLVALEQAAILPFMWKFHKDIKMMAKSLKIEL